MTYATEVDIARAPRGKNGHSFVAGQCSQKITRPIVNNNHDCPTRYAGQPRRQWHLSLVSGLGIRMGLTGQGG